MVTSGKATGRAEWRKLGYLSLSLSTLDCSELGFHEAACHTPSFALLTGGVGSPILPNLKDVSLSPVFLLCPSIICQASALNAPPSAVFLVALWPGQVR